MKKKSFAKILVLDRTTIANLSAEDMYAFRAGMVGTGIGPSCFTDGCCKTNECEEATLLQALN